MTTTINKLAKSEVEIISSISAETLASYVAKCKEDQVRLFSARMEHQGRTERATIALTSGPRGWRIWDIRGSCNRRMGGHWILLARQVAEAYTRNASSTQLPLPMEVSLRMPGDVG